MTLLDDHRIFMPAQVAFIRNSKSKTGTSGGDVATRLPITTCTAIEDSTTQYFNEISISRSALTSKLQPMNPPLIGLLDRPKVVNFPFSIKLNC